MLRSAFAPLPVPSADGVFTPTPRACRARSAPSLIPAEFAREGSVAADPWYSRPSPRPESPTHPDPHHTRASRHAASKTETHAQTHARHSPVDTAHAHPRGPSHVRAQHGQDTNADTLRSALLPGASSGCVLAGHDSLTSECLWSRRTRAGSGTSSHRLRQLLTPQLAPRARSFYWSLRRGRLLRSQRGWDRPPPGHRLLLPAEQRTGSCVLRCQPRVLQEGASRLSIPRVLICALDHFPMN